MGSGGGANRASFPAGEVDAEAASCRRYGGRRQRRTEPARRRWRGRHGCKLFFHISCSTLKGISQLCIPFLRIVWPQSQFPHLFMSDLYIPRISPHTYFPAAE